MSRTIRNKNKINHPWRANNKSPWGFFAQDIGSWGEVVFAAPTKEEYRNIYLSYFSDRIYGHQYNEITRENRRIEQKTYRRRCDKLIGDFMRGRTDDVIISKYLRAQPWLW